MRRALGAIFLALAVLVIATGSAFGALRLAEMNSGGTIAIPGIGTSSLDVQERLAGVAPANAPHGAVQATATMTGCNCAANTREPPPPPPPPPVVSIYAGTPAPLGGVPNISGDVILVSIAQQWLWAYQDGQPVFATPVTTGMPALRTWPGTFHIMWKVANTTFYSPWPVGSPYYYSPEHVNYAMYYANYGYYIHDAPWRHCFGPGTNVPHTCPDGTQETGSHGCVNVPTPSGAWLYAWTPNGATVVIR
jgi:hypothetical protein